MPDQTLSQVCYTKCCHLKSHTDSDNIEVIVLVVLQNLCKSVVWVSLSLSLILMLLSSSALFLFFFGLSETPQRVTYNPLHSSGALTENKEPRINNINSLFFISKAAVCRGVTASWKVPLLFWYPPNKSVMKCCLHLDPVAVDVSLVIIILPLWCLGLLGDEGRSLCIPSVLSYNYGVAGWRSPTIVSQGKTSPWLEVISQTKKALTTTTYRKTIVFIKGNILFFMNKY